MSESVRMRTLTGLGIAALVATMGWTAATPSKAAEAREQLRQQFDRQPQGQESRLGAGLAWRARVRMDTGHEGPV